MFNKSRAGGGHFCANIKKKKGWLKKCEISKRKIKQIRDKAESTSRKVKAVKFYDFFIIRVNSVDKDKPKLWFKGSAEQSDRK